MARRSLARRASARRNLPAIAESGAPRIEASAYSGADTSSKELASWLPNAGSADADLLPDLDVLTSRSRDLSRNNGIAAGVHQTYKDNIVGHVLRLSAKPDYRLLGKDAAWAREWGNRAEAEFRSWADSTECDAGRSLTLLGLTLQALGGSLQNGDALALPLWLPRPDSRWATRLMLVEADRLATPPGMTQRSNLRGGIELDGFGAPQAYWLRKTHPGDRYAYGRFGSMSSLLAYSPDEWERVTAYTEWGRRRVIHLHDKERTGQTRGKPIVSAVMREFQMAGKYTTTELQAAIANSLVAATLESELDPESAAQLFGENPSGAWDKSVREFRGGLKAGAIIPLPAGARLNPYIPGRPNAGFEAFMHAVLRHMAAGLNIPYELLLKDFSQTNYSSARAALLEAWRYFHGRRRWITDTWLRQIYELWLEEAINLGRIDAPDFYTNRYAYTRCRFIFAGRGWVDPVKEATAVKIRLDAGLSTLEAECAEQGDDWEEVAEQRAYEQKRLQELGVQLGQLSIVQLPADKEDKKPDNKSDPKDGEDDEADPINAEPDQPKGNGPVGQTLHIHQAPITVHAAAPSATARPAMKMSLHHRPDGSVDIIETPADAEDAGHE